MRQAAVAAELLSPPKFETINLKQKHTGLIASMLFGLL